MHLAIILAIVVSCPVSIAGQDIDIRNDTVIVDRHKALEQVTIQAGRIRSFTHHTEPGVVSIDMRLMDHLPRILGNADPMHYSQLLPGIQTNSEYDAGLHVQGCDNAHNDVSIDDVSLYNVEHLMGLFSVFNASHFSGMTLSRSATDASCTNRLGGFVNMQHFDSIPRQLHLDVSVGPISSQGTVRLATSHNSALTFSSRLSYIDLLYGSWLKYEEERYGYRFGDHNLTWLWKPNSRNILTLDAYHGMDHFKMHKDMLGNDSWLKWQNDMGALHWRYSGKGGQMKQTLYVSRYHNDTQMNVSDYAFRVRSHITDYGYQGRWKIGGFLTGVQAILHRVQPQQPSVSENLITLADSHPLEKSGEYSFFAQQHLELAHWLNLDAGLRFSLYDAHDYSASYLDPNIALTYSFNARSSLKLTTSIKHQFLSRTGFSSMGLPTEFWFSTGVQRKPQRSESIAADYETRMHGGTYLLSVGAYYKKLYHQNEYVGTISDMVFTPYDLNSSLISGEGENYGVHLMLEKRSGNLTGWVAYSLGRAFRQYPGTAYPGNYPASHERVHELNAVATYELNPRWSLGATFTFCSGTPFTAPKTFYVIDQFLITEFNDHNANRLRPYQRLDLSANYRFKKRGKVESGLNFSVYNALCHQNDIFYRMKIRKGTYQYKAMRFFTILLPSVNYYLKF